MQHRVRDTMGKKTKQKRQAKTGDIVKVYLNSPTEESITKTGKYAYGKIVAVYNGILELLPLKGRHKPDHYRELDQHVIFIGDINANERRYNRHRFNN